MSDLPPGHPRVIGKYEILSILGKGGMGIVYKARDPLIDRTVAVKTIHSRELGDDERLLARLRMEARSAGRLLHPNIVTVFDFGEHGDITYLVMEYVEGANLARVINGGVQLPLETKIDIVTQLCEGLAYAHELGVVHRDIKPSNICLTRRGEPKLLDFGLARFDETRLTKTGLTSGTIAYMSPERIRGEGGASDDIFAIGAVAYEIFTGETAFPGDTYVEVVSKIISGDYPLPPSRVANLPADLDKIIAKATATEKENRYRNASEFARELRDFRYSATVTRRSTPDQVAAAQDALKTIAIQFQGDNPYSAPDMDAPTADISTRDLLPMGGQQPAAPVMKPTAVAMPVTAPGPREPVAPKEKFTAENFAPTQALSAVVVPTVAAKVPPAAAPPAGAPAAGPTQSIARTVVGSIFRRRNVAAEDPSAEPTRSIARTVVASIFKRRDVAAEDLHGVATATHGIVETEVETPRPIMIGWLIAFALLAAALPFMASAGGMFGLVAAAAVGGTLWFFAVRSGKLVTLPLVVGAALIVRLLIVIQAPAAAPNVTTYFETGAAVAAGANPYAEAATGATGAPMAVIPPYSALFFALMAAGGSNLLLWRAMVVVADLAVVMLLWEEPRPRRALGYALFPLALIEGAWFGAIEPVAAALLLGSLIALRRQRDSLAAASAAVAAGISILAIAALPILYSAAWKMFRFLGAVAAVAAIPLLAFDGVRAWVLPLTRHMDSSPLLVAFRDIATEISSALHLGRNADALLSLLGQRLGDPKRFSAVADGDIGLVILTIVLVFTVTVIAQRSHDTDAAVADSIGIALLLSMSTHPAHWLLIVPFAIAGNRNFWLFAALASPILYLSGEGEMNFLVYAASLAVPTVIWIGFKLHQIAEGRLAPSLTPAR